MVKTRIASVALAASLFGAVAVGSVDAQTTQRGGAVVVVAAVVQAVDTVDVNNNQIDVAVVELNNSLNNLRALNNVLNNSPILSNNDIVITDVIEIGTIEDVIAIGVLEGGDLILFTRG